MTCVEVVECTAESYHWEERGQIGVGWRWWVWVMREVG